MIKECLFTKSFYMMGQSLRGCLNCSYCRLIGNQNDIIYDKLPSEINPEFRKLPVAVNLFYGDPMLQIENTINILHALDTDGHTGPVVIITKGDINLFPDIHFNLDLHFTFSTFGIDSKYDGGSMETFESNLRSMSERKNKYKCSIEYRPLIRGINDSPRIIESVFNIAKEFDAPIGFCGLQVTPELAEHFIDNDIKFEAYDGYEFGLKKSVSKDVEDLFYNLSSKYNVPVFRKTSCLISYLHNMDRDYNAHYYRPNEMRCSGCPMFDKCSIFKKAHDDSDILIEDVIPFEHEIIEKKKHVCYLYKSGVCKFANSDCVNISGKMVKIKEKITSSDLRVIKWLTGFTVDCEFDEIGFINDKWLIKD